MKIKPSTHKNALWAGFVLLLGLGLNEWTISAIKGAGLSNLTTAIVRIFNAYCGAIGALLVVYAYRENLRARIKQTLFWVLTASLPFFVIGFLELGFRT